MEENHKTPQNVTVLGLGAMGSALAKAFLKAGHRTTVWNRSADKAVPLVEKGAVAAATVSEAVAASELVVICVLNYEILEKIVKPVADELQGKTLVSLTNDTPAKARQMASWAQAEGIDYLDGSVLVPVPEVGQPDALLLYSGPRHIFDKYFPVLRALGGKSTYLGEDPGHAALYDIAMMNIFYTSLTGVLHSYALLNAEGERAEEFLPFGRQVLALAGSFLENFAKSADKKHYPGDLDNITMEAAGIAHIVHASRDAGINVSIPEAVKGAFDRAVKAGFGANGMPGAIEGIRAPEKN
ncbi:NAD(P)-dependent oxidoreductase [Sinomicrobium weinanense]|uniref:NAD(P)-dependent oxidoreductase n=1 Tax=Sinomicrobium weinanense TaxID=2842200 RepID=A0A926JRG8_9FLAO|nr:NAD(P)-binding domain-containing protein [Sinomicrobium weinanense]MBC9795959.1 NAD(P)-dependent oxidoreductase [Sinomicrobium weinanense]MBU3122078.1 NAD(P)-binding domain-containing protein [Sinomicrobium weinanense]